MDYDRLIESHIDSIAVDGAGNDSDVEVGIVDNSGARWVLKAHAVTEMVANEFRIQNIIDRVSVTDSSNVEQGEARSEIFRLLRGHAAAGDDDLNWAEVSRTIDDIKRSRLVLLEIEAVYGVTLCLLARRVSLEMKQ